MIIAGERRPRAWSGFERESGLVVIGDALVPRRVANAISEGRAAATLLRGHPANARVVARA